MINLNKISREARQEAVKNNIPFSYYPLPNNKIVNHNSAIVEAMGARRKFSYYKNVSI